MKPFRMLSSQQRAKLIPAAEDISKVKPTVAVKKFFDRILTAEPGSEQLTGVLMEVRRLGPCLEMLLLWNMLCENKDDIVTMPKIIEAHRVLATSILNLFDGAILDEKVVKGS